MAVRDSIAYQYAKWCLEEGNFYIGKYVRLQAAAWVKIVDGADEEAYIDEKMYEKLQKILALMVHPDLKQPMTEGLEPYAQLLITAIFCTKLKNDEGKDIRIGLLNIRDVVHQYHGVMNTEVQNGIFTISVLIPLNNTTHDIKQIT